MFVGGLYGFSIFVFFLDTIVGDGLWSLRGWRGKGGGGGRLMGGGAEG